MFFSLKLVFVVGFFSQFLTPNIPELIDSHLFSQLINYVLGGVVKGVVSLLIETEVHH